MKVLFRLSFALVVTVFFSSFAASETKAQSPLGKILERMETHRQSLTSLRANVTMVKYDSVLKVSDTTEGNSMYVPLKGRDALVRIDWTKPSQETLSVVKGQYIIYRPRLNQVIIGNANAAKGSGKANGALSFLNMSKEQLKANYTVIYLGQEDVGGVPTWHLELTPKTAQSYKSAELWVDGNGMPIQAKIIEKNNDTTTVLLSNIEKNKGINTNDFIVKLPKDVKRING